MHHMSRSLPHLVISKPEKEGNVSGDDTLDVTYSLPDSQNGSRQAPHRSDDGASVWGGAVERKLPTTESWRNIGFILFCHAQESKKMRGRGGREETGNRLDSSIISDAAQGRCKQPQQRQTCSNKNLQPFIHGPVFIQLTLNFFQRRTNTAGSLLHRCIALLVGASVRWHKTRSDAIITIEERGCCCLEPVPCSRSVTR